MVIANWLAEAPHETITEPETLVISESMPPDQETREYLSRRMIEHRASLRVARDMAGIIGWDRTRRRLEPGTVAVRHGDFGEMLACEVLQVFSGLEIPVRKVRYQLHSDQTLVGADVVALTVSQGAVTELHFGEAKLRTSADTSAGEEAHEQLRNWHEKEFGDILWFVGERLAETNLPLYESYMSYLASETDRRDRFHIILIWDADAWTDTVISNIPSPPDRLEPLRIRVAQVSFLTALIQGTYSGMMGLLSHGDL